MIAQARVVGLRAWLSLYSATTRLAPRVGVLLLAADPLIQLGLRLGSGREGTRVERHKHRVQGRGGRLPAALAGGVGGALADGFGVAGRHAEPVVGEGLAQRRPGGAELCGGGVDAAELFGELEGALGLGPVAEEAAGLPAQRVAVVPAPLLGFALGNGRMLSEPTSSSPPPPRRCDCGRQPEPGRRSQHGAWAG